MMTVAKGQISFADIFAWTILMVNLLSSAELADYLSHFERVARWNGWSHEEKGLQLAMNLRGAAQQVLGCLTDFEVDNYDVLRSVLKKRFSPKERVPMYRSEFRNRKKFNGESVSDFGFSLSRLVNRAYGDLPGTRERLSLLSNLFVD